MKKLLISAVLVAIVFTIAGVGGYFAVRFARNRFFFPITIQEMQALQEKGEDAAPEIPRIMECFDRDNEDLRLNAAMTLGTIGPKAVEPVRERLRDPNPKIRFAAVEALGFIGQPAAVAADDLVERLQDEDAMVRFKAVYVLGRLEVKNPAVAEGIIKALNDKDATVAEHALEAVKKMPAPPREALPSLIKLARDSNHQRRVEGIKLLGRMGDAGVPAFKELLPRAAADERKELYHAMVGLGARAKPLLPELQAIMTREKWWDGEEDLFKILTNCGADGAETVANVLKAVHDPKSPHFDLGDDRARTLLGVIGQIGPPAKGTTPLLIELLKERPTLRVATLETLGDIGPSAKEAVPAIQALKDDPVVRKQARIALLRMGVGERKADD